jgi:hypothetical protein
MCGETEHETISILRGAGSSALILYLLHNGWTTRPRSLQKLLCSRTILNRDATTYWLKALRPVIIGHRICLLWLTGKPKKDRGGASILHGNPVGIV